MTKRQFPNSRQLTEAQKRQEKKRDSSNRYEIYNSKQKRSKSVQSTQYSRLNNANKNKEIQQFFERIQWDAENPQFNKTSLDLAKLLSAWVDGALMEFDKTFGKLEKPKDYNYNFEELEKVSATILRRTFNQHIPEEQQIRESSLDRGEKIFIDIEPGPPISYYNDQQMKQPIVRYILESKRRLICGLGIQNAQSTCWLNSILQLLFSVPDIVDFLVYHRNNDAIFNIVHIDPKTDLEFIPVLNELCNFNRQIQNQKVGKSVPSQNVLFKWLLQRLSPGRSYKDVCEGIDKIFENLFKQSQIVENKFNELFGFEIVNRITIDETGTTNDVVAPNSDYILKIQIEENNRSLEDLLGVYFVPGRKIEKDSTNPNDQQKSSQTLMSRYPPYLLLQLIRINQNGPELFNNVPIHFDQILQFSQWDHASSGPAHYELLGLIEYTPHPRHYKTYLKHQNGTWCEVDDDIVTEIDFSQVQQKRGYLYLYGKYDPSKVDDNGLPIKNFDQNFKLRKSKVPSENKKKSPSTPSDGFQVGVTNMLRKQKRESAAKQIIAKTSSLGKDSLLARAPSITPVAQKLIDHEITVQQYFGISMNTKESEIKELIDEELKVKTDRDLQNELRFQRKILDDPDLLRDYLLALTRRRKDSQHMLDFFGNFHWNPAIVRDIKEIIVHIHGKDYVCRDYSQWTKQQRLCFIRYHFNSCQLIYRNTTDAQRLSENLNQIQAEKEIDDRLQLATQFEERVEDKYPDIWKLQEKTIDYLVGILYRFQTQCFTFQSYDLISKQLEPSDRYDHYEQILQEVNIPLLTVYPFQPMRSFEQSDAEYARIIRLMDFMKQTPHQQEYTQPPISPMKAAQVLISRRQRSKDEKSDTPKRYVNYRGLNFGEEFFSHPETLHTHQVFYVFSTTLWQKQGDHVLRTSDKAQFDPPERAEQLHEFLMDFLTKDARLNSKIRKIDCEKLPNIVLTDDEIVELHRKTHTVQYLDALTEYSQQRQNQLLKDYFELTCLDENMITTAVEVLIIIYSVIEKLLLLTPEDKDPNSKAKKKNIGNKYAFINCRPGGSKAKPGQASENCFMNNVVLSANYAVNFGKKVLIIGLSSNPAVEIWQCLENKKDISFLDFCFGPPTVEDDIREGTDGYVKQDKDVIRLRIRQEASCKNEQFKLIFDTAFEAVFKLFKPDLILVSSDFDLIQETSLTPYVFYLICQSISNFDPGKKYDKIPVIWLPEKGMNGNTNAFCTKAVLEGFAHLPYRKLNMENKHREISSYSSTTKDQCADLLKVVRDKLYLMQIMYTAPVGAKFVVLKIKNSSLSDVIFYLQYNQLPNLQIAADLDQILLIETFIKKQKFLKHTFHPSPFSKYQILDAYFKTDLVKPKFSIVDNDNRPLLSHKAPVSIIFNVASDCVFLVINDTRTKQISPEKKKLRGSEQEEEKKGEGSDPKEEKEGEGSGPKEEKEGEGSGPKENKQGDGSGLKEDEKKDGSGLKEKKEDVSSLKKNNQDKASQLVTKAVQPSTSQPVQEDKQQSEALNSIKQKATQQFASQASAKQKAAQQSASATSTKQGASKRSKSKASIKQRASKRSKSKASTQKKATHQSAASHQDKKEK